MCKYSVIACLYRELLSFHGRNCTEIIRDFLFLAAGYDAQGRSLLMREGDPPRVAASRIAWYRRRGVGFCLNMAGSGKQHELQGAAYPEAPGGDPLECKRVDLNDVARWRIFSA